MNMKFGVEVGGWVFQGVRDCFGVGLWKDISKEGSLIPKNIGFLERNGGRVKFWRDIWINGCALHDIFPSLFALVGSKEAWVAELLDSSGGEGGWNPLTPFNNWEVDLVGHFIDTTHG